MYLTMVPTFFFLVAGDVRNPMSLRPKALKFIAKLVLLSRKSVQQGVCKLRLGFGKHDACRGLVLKDSRESFEPIT